MNTHLSHFARTLVAAGLLLAGPLASSADFQSGTHYKLLKPAQPTNVAPGKVEVVEAFWYACGHCYLIEPKVDAWEKKGKPANVELVKLPATWNPMLQTHARLFYTVEELGKPELHGAIFREMNVRGNRLDTPEKIEAFLVSQGVAKADYRKAYAGFNVDTNFKRALDLNRRYRITSTPTFIVNGKYVTDVGMAGSEARLFELIAFLAAQDQPAG
ncbi:MAG: thiol:disulfide interchange protein DsbA/DsbL [Steroidobacteraceae bacterium]